MKNKKCILLILSLFFVILILIGYFTINNKSKAVVDLEDNSLIISTLSSEGKGNIILYNPENDKKDVIVKDKKVAITGDISEDGSSIVYADALNDSDPWQIYLQHVGKSKSEELTNTEFGKVNPRFSSDNSIYFLTGDSSDNIKIGKIDGNTKSDSIIDEDNNDRTVEAFDIKDNKIILCSTLRSLVEKSLEEDSDSAKAIDYTIYEIDGDSEELVQKCSFKASAVSSISYNSDYTKAIIGGENINGDSGQGIYQLSIDDGNVTPILNNNILSKMENKEVSELANPNLAKVSSDDNLIYFTGVSTGAGEVEIEGIKCYPTEVFSYDIENKEIKKIYTPENPSLIFSLNVKN